MEIEAEDWTELKSTSLDMSSEEPLFSRDVCDTDEDIWEYFGDENAENVSFEPIAYSKFPKRIAVIANWRD
jgi:hypothetical protein